MKTITTFLIMIFCNIPFIAKPQFKDSLGNNYEHVQKVHQYIVHEAWELLKHQIPVIANTYMNNFIGNWETAGEWTQKTISCGAYREDEEDPVYYHSFFNGWTPTSSHFWDADEGDNSLFYPTLSFPVENAYQKMRVYVYGCDVWNNKRLFI